MEELVDTPKRPARLPDPQGATIADLVLALQQLAGNDDATLEKRARYEAEAHRRLEKRENTEHPGKSVYSFPEGDVARPKPDLRCKTFWCGYPLEKDTLTPTEIELLNKVAPGAYTFTRSDGSSDTLTVTASTDPYGALSKIEFHFPCRDEKRHNLPGMVAQLREVLREQPDVAALEAELALLKRQLAVV